MVVGALAVLLALALARQHSHIVQHGHVAKNLIGECPLSVAFSLLVLRLSIETGKYTLGTVRSQSIMLCPGIVLVPFPRRVMKVTASASRSGRLAILKPLIFPCIDHVHGFGASLVV